MFRVVGQIRRQPVAFVALFFALGGGAMGASSLVRSTDTIGSGDLAGSTYGAPMIHSNAVTNADLANSSVTVRPGTGLIGGGQIALGDSGTLSVDPTAVQNRVTGTCSSGAAIASINQDGSVGCAIPPAYIEARSTAYQIITYAEPVDFPTVDANNNTSSTQAGIAFTVAKAGSYEVNVTLIPGNYGAGGHFALAVNGVSGVPLAVGAAGDPATSTRILTLAAGDTVSVVTLSGAADVEAGSTLDMVRIG